MILPRLPTLPTIPLPSKDDHSRQGTIYCVRKFYKFLLGSRLTHEELREEFNRPSFKQALKRYHGERCVNCGSDEMIEFHHIVPLALGGTNCITNVVPLCWECHEKAHGATRIKGWSKKGGRPRKEIPNIESTIQDFKDCKIGTKELEKRLGLKRRIHDSVTVMEYLHSIGIAHISNNVDIMNCNRMKNSKKKKPLQTKITYLDGTEERITPKWQ